MKIVSTKINSKLRELIQNHSEHGSSGDMKQSKEHEGKIPFLHFHWEDNKLVQDETRKEKEIPKMRVVKILD